MLAVAVFALIAAAILTMAWGSFSVDQRRERLVQARALAQEGLEAARSIRNYRFNDLLAGDHGMSTSTGFWAFDGSAENIGPFTRSISVGPVYRNGRHGDVVSSGSPGAISDPWSRRATSTVSWLGEFGFERSVTLATMFTRWSIKRMGQDLAADFTAGRRNSVQVTTTDDGEVQLSDIGQWTLASGLRSLDIGGNENAVDCAVDTVHGVLYVSTLARGSGRPELYAYDVADVTPTTTPLYTLVTAETGEDPNALSMHAGYAYLATSLNSQELMVVRLSDGALLPSWNTPSTGANARDVFATGTVAYLVTDAAGSGEPEFFAVDITNPASLPSSPLGSAEIGENVTAVTVSANGAYAYLATEDNSGELVSVRISDYQVVQRINVGGNGNASDVVVRGNRLYVAKRNDSGGEFYVFDASSPGAIPATPLATVELGRSALHLDVHGDYAFVSTDDGSAELVVITLAPPGVAANVNLPGNATADSVCAYGAYAYVVSRANSTEVMVVAGGGTANRYAPQGTFTSASFDSGSAATIWDSVDWTAAGTGMITFMLRTADTHASLQTAQWVGVDGTSANRYTTPGQLVTPDPGAGGSRWIQLRAFLETTNTAVTPILEDIVLYYDQ